MKTRLLACLAALLLATPAAAQTRPPDVIVSEIEKLVTELRSIFPTPEPEPAPPDFPTVPSGGDVQAALDTSCIVALEPGGSYTGPFTFRSCNELRGAGASVHATGVSALIVPPAVTDIAVSDLSVTSTARAVVLIGRNDAAQTTLESVPRRITFTRVTIPTHRSTRGFEVNGAEVRLIDSCVSDLWDTALGDSQAIAILNTPGPVWVEGCAFEAASENILVGGDTIKIPGVIPADLTFTNLTLRKPLAWKTDGVRRVVKNLFELKTGERVRVTNVVMDGSWKDGQDGYAIVITPRKGGAIRDVEFDRVTVRNVSAGFQITGHNIATELPTPFQTTGIVAKNSTFQVSSAQFGGRGLLAMLGMAPGTLDFDNIVFTGDGTQLIYSGDSQRVGRIRITGSLVTTGQYGIMGAGRANASSWSTWLDTLEVYSNTIAGAASALRTTLPANTYVTREEFDALAAPRLQ